MTNFTNQDNKTVGYEYYSEDNLTKLTYPDGKTVSYTYDADNRLTKVTDWLGNNAQYNYDSIGNLITSLSPGLLTTYKYDKAGRLIRLMNYSGSPLGVSSAFEFTMDANSNRTNIKRYLPITSPAFPTVSSSYSYNSGNQLMTATGKTFSYDDNGNTLSISGTPSVNFTYNFNDQLTQYQNGTTTLNYQYDVLGDRIKKTNGITTTKYIAGLVETDAVGTITAYYVYGAGLISKIEGTNAYFYQYDGLGSTIAISDKTGVIKNKYAYNDFGEIATNSTETISNPFKYVGKYGVMTDANDLLFMQARYYIPSLGRFINKDPIGLAGGLNLYNYVDSVGEVTNLYTYAGNNPINRIDPLGLWYIDINVSVGWWGGVGTGGIIIGSTGIYSYGGGGAGASGPGFAFTWSPSNPSTGWNFGAQGGFWLGGQTGTDTKKNKFWEVGFVTPSLSGTAYYVEPFRWTWQKDKKKECKK